ncbi:hypothetical protein OQA88_2946 [Cercophora sp. LCS_1]
MPVMRSTPDMSPVWRVFRWQGPGGWFEFAGALDLLAAKYTPETLPYYVVVPSIPDYGLSTRQDEDVTELTMEGASEALNELMKELGFAKCVAQEGDAGSSLAQTMCWEYEECRAFHLNMLFLSADQMDAAANITITPEEQAHLEYAAEWGTTGKAVGEKLIEWSDAHVLVSLETILTHVSFHWYTGSFGRSMWAYRSLFKSVGGPLPAPVISLEKPLGYSNFPDELAALPQSWAEHYFPNLVYYNKHDVGGHFAAMEQPEASPVTLRSF